jgi:hypothetical protein
MTGVLSCWIVEHSQMVSQISTVEYSKQTLCHSSKDIADKLSSYWMGVVDFLDLKSPQTRKMNLLASASILDILSSVSLSRFWVCRIHLLLE